MVGGGTMSSHENGAGGALARRQDLKSGPLGRYRRMVEIRLFEDKVIELFGQGSISGTTHTSQGKEAVAVGIAAVARPTDYVAGTYRGHALAMALGMDPLQVLGEITGKTLGCIGGRGGSMHLSDPDIGLWPTFAIVGAGIPVAAGAALASKLQGGDRVAIAVFGDGAANIGAFHEGLNLAAVWSLPVVFVCENNLYGEYSRINRTTPVEDLYLRARSYNMPGRFVDGQDLSAVEATVGDAIEIARGGGGPTLIEAKTYRYMGHSRSDQGLYRPEGELDLWKQRDPIELLGAKLIEENLASKEALEEIWGQERTHLEEVVEAVLAAPEASLESMFDCVLAASEPSGLAGSAAGVGGDS
jgi:acetoin:2,6-dichlorophenolindophenol oxidoreductase subunit alpha